jgi:hypothetical protein
MKAHYMRDEGLKAHLRRGRVRKYTTQEVRAQRRAKKKIGSEGILSQR